MSAIASAAAVAPVDPAMPFLAQAMDRAWMQARLRSIVGGAVDLRSIRMVRWKPARRCVLEYDIGDGSGARTLVGKARAKGLDTRTCGIVQHLSAGALAPRSRAGVSVPAVRGVVPECHMWLQDKVSGIPAWRALTGPDGTRVAARIGQALATLHRALPQMEKRHTIDDEIAHLTMALERVRAARPEWNGRLSALQGACARAARSARAVRLSAAHRDFYHDQVILDADRVWLLDFDLAAVADPALDPGNFLAHLTEQSARLLGGFDALAGAERAFLEGFRLAGGEATPGNVEIYKTLSLARHVFLSTTFEDRRAFTEGLLKLCEDRLHL